MPTNLSCKYQPILVIIIGFEYEPIMAVNVGLYFCKCQQISAVNVDCVYEYVCGVLCRTDRPTPAEVFVLVHTCSLNFKEHLKD